MLIIHLGNFVCLFSDYNMVNYLKPCRHAVKAAGSGKIIHYVNKSSSLSNLFHTLWKDVADVTISPDAVNPFVYTLEFDPAEKVSIIYN